MSGEPLGSNTFQYLAVISPSQCQARIECHACMDGKVRNLTCSAQTSMALQSRQQSDR